MSRARHVVVAAAVAVVLLLLVYPPFMVVDTLAAETRHGPLGHHPFWRPPTPDMAEQVLSRTTGPAPREGGASPRIGINRVRLVLEIGATAAGTLLVLAVQRRHRRRKEPTET